MIKTKKKTTKRKTTTKKTRPKKEKADKKGEGGQPDNKNAEKWTEEKLLEIGKGLVAWMKETAIHVFIDEYLLYDCDFNPSNLKRYSEKFESFDELIKKAKAIQELKLRKHSKSIGMPMAIFCLKCNHDYKDKIDITTNDKDINTPLPNVSHLTTQQLQELHDKFTNSESN